MKVSPPSGFDSRTFQAVESSWPPVTAIFWEDFYEGYITKNIKAN
jgi:hypothetical protein